MAVGHADGGHPLAGDCGGDGITMGIEHRTRIDHRNLALADDVRARAPVRELRRVLGDHSPDHRRHAIDAPVDDVVERSELGTAHGSPTSERTEPDRPAMAEDRLGERVGGDGDVERAQRRHGDRRPRAPTAVGDLEGDGPTVGEGDDLHAFGAVLDQQPGDEPHQARHVAGRPTDHLGDTSSWPDGRR